MSVYFARVGRYVKVGYSRNPAQRIRQIQRANLVAPEDLDRSAPVELLRVIPGNSLHETEAHCALAEFHAAGEWFHAEPELLAHLPLMTTRPYPFVVNPRHELRQDVAA